MTSAYSPLSAAQRAAEDGGRQGRRGVTHLSKTAPTLNVGASSLKFPGTARKGAMCGGMTWLKA